MQPLSREPRRALGSNRIRVVLVVKARIFRESVQALLVASGMIEVVATASSPTDAALAVASALPSVVLLGLPSMEGVITAHELSAAHPEVGIVAFNVSSEELDVVAWSGSGVVGCLAEQDGLPELIHATESAARGETSCSPCLASTLFLSARQSPVVSRGASTELTKREAEILSLICDCLSNKQIASSLHLEVSTVKNHIHSIFAKLGVHRRADAVAVACAAPRHELGATSAARERHADAPGFWQNSSQSSAGPMRSTGWV